MLRPLWSVLPGSVRASSVIRSLREPCVIQVLLPSMRQPLLVGVARVRSEPRSEPVSGSVNTAVGNTALVTNTEGDDNTATGVGALRFNTFGSQNTASGAQALSSNTEGIVNTATGYRALVSNTDGTSNTALIGEALPAEDGNNEFWTASSAGSGMTIPLNWKTDMMVCNYADQTNLKHRCNYAARGFKSRHPGGANFAFADGSVKFLKNSINRLTYCALGSRNGGEVISADSY